MVRPHSFESSTLLGAGGYGLVVATPEQPQIATKLFYDLLDHTSLQWEAAIQQRVASVIAAYVPEVVVPRISEILTHPVQLHGVHYLCGIEMERVRPPDGFQEQVHMLLGYRGHDLDEEWGRSTAQPVSDTNPTRGFFASPEILTDIWAEQGSSMTVERLAGLMGRTYRVLLDHGIRPNDVEWVWSAEGRPCLIDFGLCDIATVDPMNYLSQHGLYGLADDVYIPHEGDRGFTEFMEGFRP
jgi:hypothetical protein